MSIFSRGFMDTIDNLAPIGIIKILSHFSGNFVYINIQIINSGFSFGREGINLVVHISAEIAFTGTCSLDLVELFNNIIYSERF